MAAKVHEIAFKIAGEMSGNFIKSFKKANEAVKGFQGNLVDLNKEAAKVDKIVRLRKETGLAAREYMQARNKVAELGKAISASGKPTKKMIADFNNAKLATDKAKTALEKKRAALREVESAAGTTGVKLKTLIQRQNELKASADRATNSQKKLAAITERQQKLKGMQSSLSSGAASSAGSLSGMALAATGSVGLPVKQAMAMEDAMADVRKVTDFTPEGLKELQGQLEKLSLSIPFTAESLAQIAASAGAAGIAEKDLASFTEQAAKMGVAFDIAAEEAGTMMSKWQSGMGLSLQDTYALADATNHLSNNNAAYAGQIGEVLKRVGGLGQISGFTATETAALAASVIASGAEAEVAATGLKSLWREMGKGGSMSSRQTAAFKNVGIDPKALLGDLQKDAPKALIDTLKAIQTKVPKKQWNQYLTEMFGDEAKTAIAPMMSNLGLLEKNIGMVADKTKYAGSMQSEFEARAATTSNALILAKNAAVYVASSIGTLLLPNVEAAAHRFVAVAESAGKWVNNNKELVMSVLKVGGVVFGAVASFHALRIAIAFIVSPVLSLYRGFLLLRKGIMLARGSMLLKSAATNAWRLVCLAAKGTLTILTTAVKLFGAALKGIGWLVSKTAMLAWKAACALTTKTIKLMTTACKLFGTALKFLFTNPVGLAILAFAALVAAGVLVYKNWDTIKEKAAELWSAIKDFFGKIGDFIGGVWDKIGGIWGKVTGFFKGGSKSVNVKATGAQVPGLAKGGIATAPTLAMIGEGRESEAVLPLSRLDSMLNGGARSGGEISVNFAPTINITGAGGDAYAEVKRGLAEGQKNLKREIERLIANQHRLSYT